MTMVGSDLVERAAQLLLRREIARASDELLKQAQELVDEVLVDVERSNQMLESAQMKNLHNLSLYSRAAEIHTYLINQQKKAGPGRGWDYDNLGEALRQTLEAVAAQANMVKQRAREQLARMKL